MVSSSLRICSRGAQRKAGQHRKRLDDRTSRGPVEEPARTWRVEDSERGAHSDSRRRRRLQGFMELQGVLSAPGKSLGRWVMLRVPCSSPAAPRATSKIANG